MVSETNVVRHALESTAGGATSKMHRGGGWKRKQWSHRRKTTADVQAEMKASRSESEEVSRMTISR